MKVTGSHIMGKAESNLGRNSVHSSIDYGINANQSSPKRKDLYGDITIGHMMTTEAKAQFEGNVSRYPVPNNDSKIYKIHGQVDMSLNKSQKTTFLSEIIDRAKHPNHKRQGPGDYDNDKAFDYSKTHNTKRYQWNKLKRSSVLDDITETEKKKKGPADYSPEAKRKIIGTYTSKVPTGSLMNETEFVSAQSPASNHYKINFESSSKAARKPAANLNRDKSMKDPLKPWKRDDSPSPVTYKDVDTKWRAMSQF